MLNVDPRTGPKLLVILGAQAVYAVAAEGATVVESLHGVAFLDGARGSGTADCGWVPCAASYLRWLVPAFNPTKSGSERGVSIAFHHSQAACGSVRRMLLSSV